MCNKSKFCKDCKHIEIAWPSYCKLYTYVDKVSGETRYYHSDSWCKEQRSVGWLMARISGFCGKEGRFFELKTEA